jgi:uncharacterized protein
MSTSNIAVPRRGFFLARFPLTAFFIVAVLISWVVVLVVVRLGLPATMWTIVAITLGPTVAAIVMTAVLEGAEGVRRLLGPLILWRVDPIWYAFVLLGVPLVFILGTVFLPGAASSFDPLTPAKWSEYLWLFPLVILVGGPLFEETGWRGFALPRLERKFGPLISTIVLSLIWASWHYPQYMIPEWAAQNGGFNLRAVTVFTLAVLPMTVLLTWVFNNTRGSLLLAILPHASINTFSVYIVQLFPAQATSQINGFIGFGTAALLILILTRGRLSYDRYLSETSNAEHNTRPRLP